MPIPETSCLVYSEKLSPRLDYIINVLWENRAAVTNDLDEFLLFKGDRIQYTQEIVCTGVLHIQPVGLLQNQIIEAVDVHLSVWEMLPVFFQGKGEIPFDWFAASFFLISRYEEYLPFQPDAYGRFPANASLAYRSGFLNRPLVQEWRAKIRENFRLHSLPEIKSEPDVQFTFDMDELFQFRHVSWWRQLKRGLRSLLTADFRLLQAQYQVMAGKKPDPYDAWQSLWKSMVHLPHRPLFFFSGAEKVGGNDRQLSVGHPAVKKILNRCKDEGEIGWHPSWASYRRPDLLGDELKRVEQVVGQTLRSSRFHYLRFQLPESYRTLTELGIQHEYSMGYGEVNGFRASYADAFPWFDLSKNEVSSLMIHPFFYMDTVAIFQQKIDPDAALQFLSNIRSQYRGIIRQLQVVFHPHCLAEESWRKVAEAWMESEDNR